MPKEDYLLKYLEKLSRVIAAMFGFRDKGFPEDALHLADEAFKELLKFDIDELAIMPLEKFISTIKVNNYSSSYLELMALLAEETAKSLFLNEKNNESLQFYAKSLNLFYLLNEKDKTFSFNREKKIKELELLITNKQNQII